MKDESPGEYLTPKRVANILGLHEETILRWCKKSTNPLKAVKIEGRWYIPPESVDVRARLAQV